MPYLYGDSSASPLQENYIDLLRHAVDLSVELVRAEHRMLAEDEYRRELRERSEAESAELRALEEAVTRAARGAAPKDAARPAARCASVIAAAVADAVKGELRVVQGTLTEELARIDTNVKREVEVCREALGRFLLTHDLPGTVSQLSLDARGPHTAGQMRGCAFGVETTLELDVPVGHLFGHAPRVERLMDGLEIQAEKTSGWIRKEHRLASERLDKYYLTQAVIDAEEASLQLRMHPDGTGAGFDVEIRKGTPRVRVQSFGERGAGPTPHEVGDDDARSLLAFHQRILERVSDLLRHRRAVLDVRVDGQPLGPTARPSQLVERLVAAMAPTVSEIVRHSSSPDELVLKRVLADDRREEIFVSRADLARKLEPLPTPSLALFAPLKLGPVPLAKAAPAPAPVVVAASSAPVKRPPSDRPVARAGTIDGNDLIELAEPTPEPEGLQVKVEFRSTTKPGPDEKVEGKRAESPLIVVEGE
jgi:hypothetical protein